MDSAAEGSQLGPRTMPFTAILLHDLRTLWSGWLVRLWLITTALLTLFLLAANWTKFQDAPLIASLLFPYLVFPWFFVVVVLGVSTVSGSRAEALADGILSRPVSRVQYILATWLARVLLVLSVYLVVIIPSIMLVTLAKRPAVPDDTVTVFGVITSLIVVALVLMFLVSLGFLMGTLLRKPLLAVVVLVFVWYPIGFILSVFSLEQFSPISLSQAISVQLRQNWRQIEADGDENADAQKIEDISQTVSNAFNAVFGGIAKPAPAKPQFFEPSKFDDFSLLKVILGYGIPTLLSVILAAMCFHWRDL